MTRLPRLRRRGFTFLEVLLASAIMAVIALALYAALRLSLQARDRALSAVGPARAAEIAMGMVRRDIESALPPRGVLSREFIGQTGPEMPGTSAVRFYAIGTAPETVTTKPGSNRPASWLQQDPTSAGGGIERVELLIRPAPGTSADGVLVRRVMRNLLSSTEPAPEEEILCRGVTAFQLRYYDGFQWSDEWDSTQYENALPIAVEVTLELTRPRDPTRTATAGNANLAAYRASRTFFLPCRDEVLLTGGTQ
jgi:prepilin-type N-terminal cleavage/methylation domain-containing protein